MARAKKMATAAPVPQTDEQAAAQLREVGDVIRARAQARAAAETEIAALQQRAAEEDAPLKAREESLVEGLRVWAEANRLRLTGNKTKTIRLTTGALGWRARPPAVTVARGAKDAVIAALEAAGLGRFLRRKVDLDKEAMLKEPEAVAAIEGVAIGSAGEEFVVEPATLEGAAP
jgi:phage host-nuclease inhibitor protein Gam